MDFEEYEMGLEPNDDLLLRRENVGRRKSHRASNADWVTDWCGIVPTLRYVGAQQGWYLPEKWSETDSFGGEENMTTRGVYVIQRRPSGAVKIGFSTDVYRRRDTLQVSSDETLFIVTILDLPREWEPIVHRRLSHYRIRGEWFSPDCLEEIDDRYPRV